MSPNRAPAIAMALWLAAQIGALALSAFRVPLSIALPQPAEQSALALMLLIQIAAAAFLSPLLLTTPRQTIIALTVAWPMAQLASFLSDTTYRRTALAETYVSLWILTLSLWLWAIGRSRSAAFFPAIAAMFALGGPLLWYLRAEFVTQSTNVNWPHDALLGPSMGVLSQIIPDQIPWSAWSLPAFLIPAAILLRAIRQFIQTRNCSREKSADSQP
jgi:hypothetical protein